MKNQKLLTVGDAKTSKGEKLGYVTAILYLAPHKISGKNLCPHASAGCADACLYTAGRGRFSNVQNARIKKARFFIEDRVNFMDQIKDEIKKLFKKHGSSLVVRLNGTSDIPFENIKFSDGLNIFERFPDITFYDYTKDSKRVLNNVNKNYSLTFSRSETLLNNIQANELLNLGYNVAVVFDKELYQHVTTTKKIGTHYVVDGDEHDLRFLDGRFSIVALKAKGDAKKDSLNFVISNLNQI